jgi:thiamine pyrophosphate-dependent acetolactate synthase large subunit-like protein
MVSPRPALDRRAAVAELLAERGGLVVVSGLGSSTYDVFAAGDRDANFYLWGAMGGAAMIGLGLALAQPRRPVAVITGDGEQLMGLGSLATIAIKKPGNLSLVVLDNGYYGETGMQCSHTSMGLDLHALAEAAGFASAADVRDMAQVKRLRAEIGKLDGGPRFATIRISAAPVERALPDRDGVNLKNRFRRGLGIGV